MTSEPTEYELFVRELHQKLIDKQGINGINVQHNVKIKGKSGSTHQIDVYWEHCIAGVRQHYCVECKYWKSDVKKSDVASFVGILNDIGSARGIFVTTKGFQKGAQLFATQNNVILVTANKIKKQYPAQLKVGMPTYDIHIEFEDLDSERLTKLEEWKSLGHDSVDLFNSSHEYLGTIVDLVKSFEYKADGFYGIELPEYYVNVFGDFIKLSALKVLFKNNFIEQLTLHGYSEVAEAVANYILTNENILLTW